MAYFNGGYAFKSNKFSESGIRVIRISDFDKNGIKNEKIVRYPYSNDLLKSKINISDIDFISCDENFNEDQYNDSLCKHLEGSKMMHKTKISIGGGKGNNIEPCDILYKNNFIHIKSNGGSSYLSHLFNQATVSCTFLKDSNFRKKFNKKMNELKIDYYLNEDFIPSNYNIVLGIITRSGNTNSRPKIPFFSKVSIKYAKEVIERNLGYKMFIKNIRK